jgi:pSer/pThr/pTyr-binding forkhead associated (FHA) protein
MGRVLIGFNGQTIAERELTPGRFIVGRTPDNDLQIDSKYISRHHAQIVTSAHMSVLEDLNSTNGVYVRAKRVRRRMLNDGDVIQIGQHEIMYFDDRMARSRMPAHEDDSVPLMNNPFHADRPAKLQPEEIERDEDVDDIPVRQR